MEGCLNGYTVLQKTRLKGRAWLSGDLSRPPNNSCKLVAFGNECPGAGHRDAGHTLSSLPFVIFTRQGYFDLCSSPVSLMGNDCGMVIVLDFYNISPSCIVDVYLPVVTSPGCEGIIAGRDQVVRRSSRIGARCHAVIECRVG